MTIKTMSWLQTLALSLLPLVVLASMSGCWPFSVKLPDLPIPPGANTVTTPEKPDGAKTVAQLEKELAEAKKKSVEADQKVQAVERALADARLVSRQKKLWWACGICVIGILGCIAGAIFLPGAARYFISGAFSFAGVALVAYLIASVLPYLPYIMAALAVLAIGTLIWLWRKDHSGLRKVVEAVESVKGEIPEYKTKLGKFINGSTDKYVTKVREKLNLIKKEV
jgi:hypothetical protein